MLPLLLCDLRAAVAAGPRGATWYDGGTRGILPVHGRRWRHPLCRPGAIGGSTVQVMHVPQLPCMSLLGNGRHRLNKARAAVRHDVACDCGGVLGCRHPDRARDRFEALNCVARRCMVPAAKGTMTVAGSEKALEGQLGAALGSRAHLEKAAMAKRSPIRNFLTQVTDAKPGHSASTGCTYIRGHGRGTHHAALQTAWLPFDCHLCSACLHCSITCLEIVQLLTVAMTGVSLPCYFCGGWEGPRHPMWLQGMWEGAGQAEAFATLDSLGFRFAGFRQS